MTSRVRVNMTICSKTSVIEVTQNDEGEYEIKVDTDCDHVQEFIDSLGTLSIVDISDKENSKVWECFKKAKMSANCLTPAALMSAAWMEAGMLSKNLAKSRGSVSVEFLVD